MKIEEILQRLSDSQIEHIKKDNRLAFTLPAHTINMNNVCSKFMRYFKDSGVMTATESKQVYRTNRRDAIGFIIYSFFKHRDDDDKISDRAEKDKR